MGWREYIYWTKQVFGPDSKEYLATVSDSAVWEEFLLCYNLESKSYAEHPFYDDYPAVGISQAQAMAYSKWRSDRVFEVILIRLKKRL